MHRIMNKNKVNPRLVAYIEKNILPHYELNDSAHNMTHIRDVFARAFDIADTLPDINYDIVYTLVSFHDIGYHVDQRRHEEFGADTLLNDKELKKFFSDDEMQMMARELRVHDTLIPDREARNIYGRILCSADLDNDLDMVLKRLYYFRRSYFKDMSVDDIVDSGYKFLGMIVAPDSRGHKDKMYFDIPAYEQFRREVGVLLADKDAFRAKFLLVNGL